MRAAVTMTLMLIAAAVLGAPTGVAAAGGVAAPAAVVPPRPEPTVTAPKPPPALTPGDRDRLAAFLRQRFGDKPVRLEPKPQRPDRADVYLDDIYLGVLESELDGGELSWTLTMPILPFDLDEAP